MFVSHLKIEKLCLVKILGRGNKTQDNLLSVRELQADEVEHLESMGLGEIVDELAELHLAVRLPSHIYHVHDFVGAWTGDIRGRRSVVSDTVDETHQWVWGSLGSAASWHLHVLSQIKPWGKLAPIWQSGEVGRGGCTERPHRQSVNLSRPPVPEDVQWVEVRGLLRLMHILEIYICRDETACTWVSLHVWDKKQMLEWKRKKDGRENRANSWDATNHTRVTHGAGSRSWVQRVEPDSWLLYFTQHPLPHTFFYYPSACSLSLSLSLSPTHTHSHALALTGPPEAQLASVWWQRTAGLEAVGHREREKKPAASQTRQQEENFFIKRKRSHSSRGSQLPDVDNHCDILHHPVMLKRSLIKVIAANTSLSIWMN